MYVYIYIYQYKFMYVFFAKFLSRKYFYAAQQRLTNISVAKFISGSDEG